MWLRDRKPATGLSSPFHKPRPRKASVPSTQPLPKLALRLLAQWPGPVGGRMGSVDIKAVTQQKGGVVSGN